LRERKGRGQVRESKIDKNEEASQIGGGPGKGTTVKKRRVKVPLERKRNL